MRHMHVCVFVDMRWVFMGIQKIILILAAGADDIKINTIENEKKVSWTSKAGGKKRLRIVLLFEMETRQW